MRHERRRALVPDLLSWIVGGVLALAVLYLAYAVGMVLQFETMVNAQPWLRR